jgi:hypothetical protein
MQRVQHGSEPDAEPDHHAVAVDGALTFANAHSIPRPVAFHNAVSFADTGTDPDAGTDSHSDADSDTNADTNTDTDPHPEPFPVTNAPRDHPDPGH